MTSRKTTLLDCTLRDGGYYCNWCYAPNLVEHYLQSMSQAGIDFVEIGLRSTTKNKFQGPFAYSTDAFIETLPIPKGLKIGVMINASDFLINFDFMHEEFKKHFKESSQSQVKLVRIASHFKDVPHLNPLITELKQLGYRVGVNLMQAGGKEDAEIIDTVEALNSLEDIDVLYFADSIGNMNTIEVTRIASLIKSKWKKEIGIHTHDNMGNALANSIQAFHEGVNWLDATVLGMGRGAGNARMEYLLNEVNKLQEKKYSAESIYPLVLDFFKPLQEDYKWGPNLLYYLAAENKIHPTFIQEMLSLGNVSSDQMISAVQKLSHATSSSFNSERLLEVLGHEQRELKGTWSPSTLFSGKDILLVANGPSAKEHREGIENYIKSRNPYVVALNTQSPINTDLIDCYCACHPIRILLETNTYQKLKRPLLTSLQFFKESEKSKLENVEILDYGIKVRKGAFNPEETQGEIPRLLAFAYALAAVNSGQAKSISLVGFDGYAPGLPQGNEVHELLQTYSASSKPIALRSLTPTLYDIPTVSLYSPYVLET